MADTLEIFGVEYTNVAGIIAKDDNGVDQTYTKGGGHLTQDQDGFLVIPPDGSGGGGGSSDFSTAEVTVVLGGGIQTLATSLPVCTDFVDPEYPEDNYSGIEVNNGAESGKYMVPLYKGFCYLRFDSLTGDISVTGDANIVSGMFTTVAIYGDCTITIS